jgi:threonine/homoserine/homoserine lactone efflux protein
MKRSFHEPALMNALLPPWPVLAVFLIASLILAITPGPGVFYIVTRALAQGRRAGLVSAGGVALGNFGNAIAAAVGLAALFSISAIAFTFIKYAGALYLVWLGVKALRAARNFQVRVDSGKQTSSHLFRDGFAVALLNPKTTIFFAAFLPQFLTGRAGSIAQSIMLGALFVGMAAITDCCYALAAGSMAPTLVRAPGVRRFGRYVTAGALIGLGVFTAVAGTRQTR